jgi:radical SAM protein with 4Fe4S-binding SPASM domain
MRTKNYWEQHAEADQPFDLPKRITQGIERCRKNAEGDRGADPAVRYIWIYLTGDGLRQSRDSASAAKLSLEEWLSVIDESAALGAEWMVVYVGASLSETPEIWRLCEWAQDVHELNVGLHLTDGSLTEEDIGHITGLDAKSTYLVADESALPSLRFLEERGLHLCKANNHFPGGMKRCNRPANLACVGASGRLFSCGLVIGDQEYQLGDYRDRRLDDIMTDDALPHAVTDVQRHPKGGCDGCPPLIAEALERENG